MTTHDELEQAHRRWQERRHAELAAADSWLGLIALAWLEAGSNSVGSAPECTVVLPTGPARLGELVVDGSEVAWLPAGEGMAVVEAGRAAAGGRWLLASDAQGQPSRIVAGDLVMFVIEREGRLAVRLRDRAWASRRSFAGLETYAYDPAWRIDADWEAIDPPLAMAVPNVTGDVKSVLVSRRAVFAVAGHLVTLLPMEVDDEGVFFIFRDATSGRQTYGAGRFLRAPAPVGGRITLDFNRAYNPPCAFTSFATCPLPPPENWLPFAVPAGERKWLSDQH